MKTNTSKLQKISRGVSYILFPYLWFLDKNLCTVKFGW